MSGGAFDYNQYRIRDIIDEIEIRLDRQGKEIPKEDRYGSKDYYDKYPNERFYEAYPEEIQQKMREGIVALKKAEVYAHRIDWFISGDDGEESFIERLSEELAALGEDSES